MAAMVFQFTQNIMFKHCDPAGIVFYPRYFEMMNDTIEVFFRDALDYPFHDMHPENGTPTVAIKTEFHAPSLHGDTLLIDVHVQKIGQSSVGIKLIAECQGALRFTTDLTLVHVGALGRPSDWPALTRDKLKTHLEG